VYITVATVLPAVLNRAEIKAKVTKWYEYQREYRTIGARKIKTKFMHKLTMKKPNMSCEAMRMRVRIVLISAGRAIVAPARSSSNMIATGLNHHKF
jgi:hypothetical protein